jgi:putative ABC transport system substrate-binding protein
MNEGAGRARYDDTIGAKWIQLLKETVPRNTRVALIQSTGPGAGTARMLPAINAAARSTGVQLTTAAVRDGVEIERAYKAFAREPDGGVIAMPDPLFTTSRDRLIAVAARYRMPTVYYFRFFATSGGLMSYGPHTTDIYQRAASYADRTFKGARPADLPVQLPTKFELVVNMKTPKALGLTIPQSLLLRADEVIH